MEGQSRWYFPKILGGTLVLFGPFAVGAVEFNAMTVLGFAVVLSLFAWGLRARLRLPAVGNIILLLGSACFTVTVFDLVSRPLLCEALLFRPSGMFESPWPPMPLVSRYTPNVHYYGRVSGDLVGLTGVRADREEREERFVTDEYGFRNELTYSWRSRPLDVIILGDSMADGANTTQDAIVSSVLSRDYNVNTYNLSMTGAQPWHEYVTLASEIDRLPIKSEGTILAWLIFTGNDLEDPCYPVLEKGQLPWNGWFRSRMVSYRTFRQRSPVRLLRIYAGVILGNRIKPNQLILKRDFLDGKKLLFLSPYAKESRIKVENILQHHNLSCIKSTMAAMKQLANQKHLSVAVVLVPSKEEVYSWVLNGRPPWSTTLEPSGFSVVFKSISEQHGFSFLDLRPFLVEASQRAWEESYQLLWWHDDIHWNARGQKEAASVIYSQLLSQPGAETVFGKRGSPTS